MSFDDLSTAEIKMIGKMQRGTEKFSTGGMRMYEHYAIKPDALAKAGTSAEEYKALLEKAGFEGVSARAGGGLYYLREGSANYVLQQNIKTAAHVETYLLSQPITVKMPDASKPKEQQVLTLDFPRGTRAQLVEEMALGIKKIFGADFKRAPYLKSGDPLTMLLPRMGTLDGQPVDILDTLRETAKGVLTSTQWRESNVGPARGGVLPRVKLNPRYLNEFANAARVLGLKVVCENNTIHESTMRIRPESIPAFKEIPGLDIIEYGRDERKPAPKAGELHYGGAPKSLDPTGEFAPEKLKQSWASEQRARAAQNNGPRTPG